MSIDRPGFEELNPGAVADGTYALTVVGGTVVTLVPIALSPPVLLTTEIAGVPDVVWDNDNQLVYTEAP